MTGIQIGPRQLKLPPNMPAFDSAGTFGTLPGGIRGPMPDLHRRREDCCLRWWQTMGDHPETRHFEPRWPAGLTILAVLALLALLPGRVRLGPQWVTSVLGLLILAPMTAAGVTRGRADLLRAERLGTLAFFTIATVSTLVNLANLIREILDPSSAIGGIELLASSIAIWVTNVLSFSLMYWQLDRGGPEARLDADTATPDWQFPREAMADATPRDWRPAFVD